MAAMTDTDLAAGRPGLALLGAAQRFRQPAGRAEHAPTATRSGSTRPRPRSRPRPSTATSSAATRRVPRWTRSYDDPDVVALREKLRQHNGIQGLEVLAPAEVERAAELFHRDGFVVVRDALDPAQLERMRGRGRSGARRDAGRRPDVCGRWRSRRAAAPLLVRQQLGVAAHAPRRRVGRPDRHADDHADPDRHLRLAELHRASAVAATSPCRAPSSTRASTPTTPGPNRTTLPVGSPRGSCRSPRSPSTSRWSTSPARTARPRQIPGTQNSRHPIPNLLDEPEWMKLSTVCPAPAGSAIFRDLRCVARRDAEPLAGGAGRTEHRVLRAVVPQRGRRSFDAVRAVEDAVAHGQRISRYVMCGKGEAVIGAGYIHPRSKMREAFKAEQLRQLGAEAAEEYLRRL